MYFVMSTLAGSRWLPFIRIHMYLTTIKITLKFMVIPHFKLLFKNALTDCNFEQE